MEGLEKSLTAIIAFGSSGLFANGLGRNVYVIWMKNANKNSTGTLTFMKAPTLQTGTTSGTPSTDFSATST